MLLVRSTSYGAINTNRQCATRYAMLHLATLRFACDIGIIAVMHRASIQLAHVPKSLIQKILVVAGFQFLANHSAGDVCCQEDGLVV